MSLSASLLPSFDQVIAGTRRLLESIPDDRLDWKPHAKSYTIGELGSHLANLPTWGVPMIEQDALDIAPDGGGAPTQPTFGSVAEMVAGLDEHATAARTAIEAASDETLMGSWTLLLTGEEKFTAPRIGVLRSFIVEHMIHHRGQLTVYLRLLDVPVKPTFGPTADFPDF